MNIRDIFITLRYKISYGSTVEWYNFWYIVLRKKRKITPQVASINETISTICLKPDPNYRTRSCRCKV